jgi:hypothetical protein
MFAYLLDEALAFLVQIGSARRPGPGYDSPADVPISGPVAPGPAAHIVRPR